VDLNPLPERFICKILSYMFLFEIISFAFRKILLCPVFSEQLSFKRKLVYLIFILILPSQKQILIPSIHLISCTSVHSTLFVPQTQPVLSWMRSNIFSILTD
jgi:hypothetical protein